MCVAACAEARDHVVFWSCVPRPVTVWCLVARAKAYDRVVCWQLGRGRQSPGDGGLVVGVPGRDR